MQNAKVVIGVLPAAATMLMASLALASSAKIDPTLTGFATGLTEENTVRVIALFDGQSAGEMPIRYDNKAVVSYLKARNQESWKVVQADLVAKNALGTSVKLDNLQWISDSATFNVTREGLKALATAKGVIKIYANHKIFLDAPVSRDAAPITETAGYDFADIKLDVLIQKHPTITGKGIVIGQVDTGVDGQHAAVGSKILKFWDTANKQEAPPTDADAHGTHTAGTMVGGDRTTNLIGMAPEAKLISAGHLAGFDEMLGSMQYFADEAAANHVIPRAINNSWNCSGAPDVELFYKGITAWEAAGILPVFSAGNAGPSAGSITPPHEHPSVIAVAATGENGKVTSFSSRGPGKFHGQVTQKPDFSAPGENINSSVPGGGYQKMSGTSMSAPHVTGASALVWQAHPALSPAQVRQILTQTVVPTASNGLRQSFLQWNADYGFGKLDVNAAVEMALRVRDLESGDASMRLGMISPDDLTAMAVSQNRAQAMTEADFSMPAAFEGEGWKTAEELFQ